MSEKDQLKARVKEAEIYRSQGLLDQALEKYRGILEFVEGHDRLSKDEKLLGAVKQKIQSVEDKLSEIEAADEKPELADDVQSLISKLFAFSKSKDQVTSIVSNVPSEKLIIHIAVSSTSASGSRL